MEIDHRAQALAFGLREEVADRVKLGLVGIDLVDAGVGLEPFAHLLADAAQRVLIGNGFRFRHARCLARVRLSARGGA